MPRHRDSRSRSRNGRGRDYDRPGHDPDRGRHAASRNDRGHGRSRSRSSRYQMQRRSPPPRERPEKTERFSHALAAVQAAVQVREKIKHGWDEDTATTTAPSGIQIKPPSPSHVKGMPMPAESNTQGLQIQHRGGDSGPHIGMVQEMGNIVVQELDIEPEHVKFIIGKQGEFLHTVQKQCQGAFVKLDKYRRPKALCEVRGPRDKVKAALTMIQLRLASLTERDYVPAGFVLEKIIAQPHEVSKIIGTKGDVLRAIQEETGAVVTLQDQMAQQSGNGVWNRASYTGPSTVRVVGTREAVDLCVLRLRDRMGRYLDIQVEQARIGKIIGSGGATFREIKAATGANIWIDQSSQNEGWSLLRIKDPGSPEHEAANRMIYDRLGPGTRIRFQGVEQVLGPPGSGKLGVHGSAPTAAITDPHAARVSYGHGLGGSDPMAGGMNFSALPKQIAPALPPAPQQNYPHSGVTGSNHASMNSQPKVVPPPSGSRPSIVAPPPPSVMPAQSGGSQTPLVEPQTKIKAKPAGRVPREAIMPPPQQPGRVEQEPVMPPPPKLDTIGALMDPLDMLLMGESLAQKGIAVEDLSEDQVTKYVQTGQIEQPEPSQSTDGDSVWI
eukprot:gnl/MRDRNA2_/MRDRNA2_103027_c0_seq1.p1 gnl/MRDRNA2_/MRDRNA2_103027_c0~~gnl/MRDRNA2_/MRDRNA2_103027_c0_seq1.p1  ORF type:complete len:631 (+),score=108.67 gnl/MRDRNA2_/MRDRNA2_103027_c0_seq1:66-1895(+)